MLSIFANAMRIASRTDTNENVAEHRYNKQQDRKHKNREYYQRWAETQARYFR